MSKIYCSDSGACDVCVIGAGLAGCMAAIEAASHGAAVSILSSASVCSGSSFYPGTWGLGLIAPLNDDDASNLYEQICRVGCGMVDNKLALSFVDGIRPAVAHLESLGVRLKKAEHKEEQAFIPCFDNSHRDWHGLLADSMHEVFAQKIHELGIIKAEQCEVLKIVQQDDGCICGIVAVHKGSLRYIPCKAVILASGVVLDLFLDAASPWEADGEAIQEIASLAPGESVTVSWKVKLTDGEGERRAWCVVHPEDSPTAAVSVSMNAGE